jgi:hypothetical protein
MYREEKLKVNRRYQRKLVWTLKEKQKLIESIIKKYPIPAILIAELSDTPGTYEIIDGLQRLQAILSYIENSFPGIEGKFFNINGFPTAKKYADEGKYILSDNIENVLNSSEVSTILDYTLQISVMRNASDSDIDDVFDRINTYGHRLSDQERRQAGISSFFSELVRKISCIMRGDDSENILLLTQMPSISIDLPKTKHGYQIKADEVFWVNQGILRSTDLRDSLDEQYIADIAACIIGGKCVERSKVALDNIYLINHKEYDRINDALQIYGSDRFVNEFLLCIDEIVKICNVNKIDKLRDIVFSKKTSNPFPSVFVIIFIAFHELLISDNKKISNYEELKKLLDGLSNRIEIGQKASSPEERRKNIDQVKGLIQGVFIPNTENPRSLIGNTAPDIEAAIRRSEIELSNYELKQGILKLYDGRQIDKEIINKFVYTIAGIVNNGPQKAGKIIIGVADKESDANKIKELDGITPNHIGNKFIVGIIREAKQLKISLEDYVSIIKDGIKDSDLTESIKMNILSNIDFNNYYGLGILTIEIPPQKEMAFVGDDVYWRNFDSTELTNDAKKIATIAKRF